ncbi:MAG: DNA methyltransferase, partial [Sodaliphilus sp.]|nr:DNA methyltransferase [Sodaliphilus sp.]
KAKSINEKGYYFLLYNKNGTMPSDVWNITPANSPVERYNVFPESLCHLMILSTCPDGGIVLDPYCGLGTACKVAYDLHRRAIGFDVNETYLKKPKQKIQHQPLSLF